MKIQERMNTQIEYINKKGETSTGTVTNFNLVNQEWVYEVDNDIYINWNEVNENYFQID